MITSDSKVFGQKVDGWLEKDRKGVGKPGEIREWKAGKFQKLESGGWQKVKAGREHGKHFHEHDEKDREDIIAQHERLLGGSHPQVRDLRDEHERAKGAKAPREEATPDSRGDEQRAAAREQVIAKPKSLREQAGLRFRGDEADHAVGQAGHIKPNPDGRRIATGEEITEANHEFPDAAEQHDYDRAKNEDAKYANDTEQLGEMRAAAKHVQRMINMANAITSKKKAIGRAQAMRANDLHTAASIFYNRAGLIHAAGKSEGGVKHEDAPEKPKSGITSEAAKDHVSSAANAIAKKFGDEIREVKAMSDEDKKRRLKPEFVDKYHAFEVEVRDRNGSRLDGDFGGGGGDVEQEVWQKQKNAAWAASLPADAKVRIHYSEKGWYGVTVFVPQEGKK